MTDRALVLRKLGQLREYLDRARRRRPDDVATWAGDVDRQDALALAFMVAVQEAVDIAFHVAADEGWGVPSTNREAFELLARNGVVEDVLASRMGDVVGVRNRIAHGYTSLDPARLWRELPLGFDALQRYGDAIERFLAKA